MSDDGCARELSRRPHPWRPRLDSNAASLGRGLAIRISHNHRTVYDYIPAFGNLAWERSGAAAEPRP